MIQQSGKHMKLISSFLGVLLAVLVIVLKVMVDNQANHNHTQIASFSGMLSITPTPVSNDSIDANKAYLPLIVNDENNEFSANWNVLHSETYGYTIKYPQTFTFIDWAQYNDFSNSEYEHLITFYSDKSIDEFQSPEIGLAIYKNPSKQSLTQWVSVRYTSQDNVSSSALTEQSHIAEIKEITVNEQTALSYVEQNPMTPSVVFGHNNAIVKLYYTNAYSEDEDLGIIFNEMLRTFHLE